MEAIGDQAVTKKLPAEDGGEVTFGVAKDIAGGKCMASMQIGRRSADQQIRFVGVVGDKEVEGQQRAARGTRAGMTVDIEFNCEAGAITGLEMQLRKFEYKSFGKIKLPAEK